jgi:hypothetical protein
MSPLPHWTLLRGRDEPPPESVPLRAGPLCLQLEEGALKYVRLGGREVLRRVYAAVRDRNWGTVPARISDLRIESRADSFRASFVSEHRQGEVDFAWRGRIEGRSDGTLRFELDGEARSTFYRNRIGFCVLHPPEVAGGPCHAKHADGRVERGVWPLRISPWAPFTEIRALRHEVLPGLWARLDLEGEVFEMEDHRNWTDASFKTFCTPLSVPYPVEVTEGTRVRQAVALRLEGTMPEGAGDSCRAAPVVRVAAGPAVPLPRLGLGVASHGAALSALEIERLKVLHLSHLRVDLKLSQPAWEEALRRAWDEARAMDADLEVALHLPAAAPQELEALVEALRTRRPRVSLFLVFRDGERETSALPLQLARAALRAWDAGARIAGGTDYEFVDVNRRRPPLELLDAVSYSINPQVHAFDDDSLVETLSAQGTTIESARAFAGGLPLAISPLTLKRRVNPDATGPAPPPGPGELPPEVDVRQMSLFGAAWTAVSLKHLAEGGVWSATYYETTGWRGVLEVAAGSPLPEAFPSLPGAAFPLYHVLADAGEMRGGEVLPCRSSHPLCAEALALRRDGRLRVLIANLRPETQAVRIEGLAERISVRLLDESCAEIAMLRPEEYRSQRGAECGAAEGALELELGPYAVARLDMEAPGPAESAR